MKSDYSHRDLMETARVTFNNLAEEGKWEKKSLELDDKNFLTLATEMVKTEVDKRLSSLGRGDGGRTQPGWQYNNPNVDKVKRVRGRTYKWCNKDCHAQPMWCGRRTCLSKEEYATKIAKNDGRKTNKPTMSKDFRIALAALTSVEDYEALEDQFFQVKE